MDTNESRAAHLEATVRDAGLGEGFTVARLGEDVLFHYRRHQEDGSWLASMKAIVAWEPILIGEPKYLFVPTGADRYAVDQAKPPVPAEFAAEAESFRTRLLGMRDEGLFETEGERAERANRPGL